MGDFTASVCELLCSVCMNKLLDCERMSYVIVPGWQVHRTIAVFDMYTGLTVFNKYTGLTVFNMYTGLTVFNTCTGLAVYKT